MATSPQTAPSQNSIEKSIDSLQQPPEAATSLNSKPPASSPSAPSPPPPASPPISPPPASSPPSPPRSPPASPPLAPPTSPPPPDTTPPPKESPIHPPPPKESLPTASPPPPSTTHLSPPPPTPNSTPTGPHSPPAPIFSPPSPTAPPSGPLTRPPPSHSPSANKLSGSSGGSDHSPPRPQSDSTNVAIIAGIVVGGVVILALLITCLILSRSRRNKKQPYYVSPGHGPVGAEMYFQASTQWNSPQPMEQIVKIPPPPGSMGTPIGYVGGWAAAPPTQPVPANSSSEFSSGFSGQHQTPSRQPPSPNVGAMNGFTKSQFTYEELAAATGRFSQANLLGQGGFGFVHKGILPDGREVAIKSLKSGSGQGEREFQAEVDIISRVHHRHLVSLVGYFVADAQRMLVYEFVPNGTLEFHLHGKGQPVMNWATRLRIAMGSAKGLGYLHEDCHPRIIHRDIKAANILLDYNFEAMVADFGLAKLTSDNYTHVSTRVMGTFGYLAPEYASSGKLTEKSDVFSYGVMLLELITGRRPVDPTDKIMEDCLVDWARPLVSKSIEDGNYEKLVDPRLQGNYDPQEMARMVACAAACIRHSARRRPRMSQIVRTLDGDASLEDLNDVSKTAHGTPYNNPTGNTETYDTCAYNADMMKFRKMVMSTSQEFQSSEYGDTSEYGLNTSTSSGDSRELPQRKT